MSLLQEFRPPRGWNGGRQARRLVLPGDTEWEEGEGCHEPLSPAEVFEEERATLVGRLRRAVAPIRYPGAEWRPFYGKGTTALTHDIVCLHTMVGTLAGSWSWANGAGRPYWHFGVDGYGACWQCQDLRYRSAANLDGNRRVIPIETADMRGPFPAWSGSDVPAWTAAQVDALVDLVAWLCKRFGIPPVLVDYSCPGARGISYHRCGIDPWRRDGCPYWSKATGKVCPGDRRIRQLVATIVPRVRARLGGTSPIIVLPENPPTPLPEEENDMALIVKLDDAPEYWLWNGMSRRHIASQAEANLLVYTGLSEPGPGGGGAPYPMSGVNAQSVRRSPVVGPVPRATARRLANDPRYPGEPVGIDVPEFVEDEPVATPADVAAHRADYGVPVL